MKQSIAYGIEKIGVPCVIVRCKGEDLFFIIDTGSTDNLLVEFAYDCLAKSYEDVIKDTNETVKVTGVGGVCKGKRFSFSFSIGRMHFNELFSVLPNSDIYIRLSKKLGKPMCGVLGSKFLKEHQVIIDYGNQLVYTNRQRKKGDMPDAV
jgi:hypothetical protein